MVIDEDILYQMGATIENYNVSDFIFCENNIPSYYYQIAVGEVKLNNYNEEGKEIIQTILESGESIGESLLFMDKPYPINAVALTACVIIKLSKSSFFLLLKKYPEISLDMNRYISQKLKTLMDYLKSFEIEKSPFSFQIPLTRQQMASLTGLCVETTIRTIKAMERNNMVKICNRKILY
jgi:CRP-like cAMP-binding protein